MRKYVFTDSTGRIIGIRDCTLFPDAALTNREYNFQDGFAFGTESDYRLVNGELTHDPLPLPEVDMTPTPEERIAALEAALLELIMGGESA